MLRLSIIITILISMFIESKGEVNNKSIQHGIYSNDTTSLFIVDARTITLDELNLFLDFIVEATADTAEIVGEWEHLTFTREESDTVLVCKIHATKGMYYEMLQIK